MTSLRIEDAVAAVSGTDARVAKKKDRAQRGPAAMSHISGVKRPLTHTNSFTGERVPVHGVETPHEEGLGKVRSHLYRLKTFFCEELYSGNWRNLTRDTFYRAYFNGWGSKFGTTKCRMIDISKF